MSVRPSVHNVVHLALAALGAAMLALAYLDWIAHPWSLLLSIP